MKAETYLIPPEGSKDVGKRAFQVLGAIVADKIALGLPETYNRNYKLRRNRHWKQQSSSEVPLVSANFIYTHIQRSINTLTDNNPIFDISAKFAKDEGRSKQVAEDLQRVAEDWWLDTEQQTKFEESVTNGELYAIAVEKITFDERRAQGLGDVVTRIVDPMFFGWYPVDLKDITEFQESEAVCQFWVESCRKLREKYPDLAEKIKPDTSVMDELNDQRREISNGKGGANSILLIMQNIVSAVSQYFRGSQDISEADSERTVVCELWVRDNSTVKRVEVLDDGTKVEISEPKYTGGIRYILACSGGSVVLEDKDNPNVNHALDKEQIKYTYLYDKFPFAVANSVIDTSNAWGMSDVEQVDKLNMEINKAMSQFVLEKDKFTRRKLLNPRDSGVENHELNAFASIVNPTSAEAAKGIKYLDVPEPNHDLEKSIGLFKELMFMIVGTFDIDQAQLKSNVIAYKAIAALLERAATMMRGKIRNYSHLLRERGRMYVSHVQNFYTEERWISFKDSNGKAGAMRFKGSDMMEPVNLTIVAGSTLPISRIQQREEAIELFKMRSIDQQAFLEHMEWPNRDQIVKRMAAGPLGGLFEQLEAVGMPAEIIEYLKAVAQADPKKLQQALVNGEFPVFQEVMEQLINEKAPQLAGGKPPSPEQMKAEAETRKLESEVALNAAKAQTEAVKQQVALAGVQFDEEQMKLERAKAVADMEKSITENRRENVKAAGDIVSKLNNKPGHNEKGLKSNNQSRLRMLGEGGHVKKNEAVIVGDKGEPEIFVPDKPGTVVPLKKILEPRVKTRTEKAIDAVGSRAYAAEQAVRSGAKKVGDFFRQMGKDIRKVGAPRASADTTKPKMTEERARELEAVRPGHRKAMNEILDQIDGTTNGRKKEEE